MWLGQGAGEGDRDGRARRLLDAARNRFSGRHDIPFSVDRTLHSVEPVNSRVSSTSASTYWTDRAFSPPSRASSARTASRSSQWSSRASGTRPTLVPHHMALTDSVNATMKDLAKHASVDSIGACLRVIDGGRE